MVLRENHSAAELSGLFTRGEPFPHLVLDNFLDESFARELYASFPKFADEHAMSELGRVGGKAVREDVASLSPAFLRLHEYFSSSEFLGWMSQISGIPDLIFDPEYVGGGTHENLPGQDMSVHVDFNYHPKRGWHRRLNALVYLNPVWQADWGGELELWREPWSPPSRNKIRKIAPSWNRLVVFPTTEASWHGFEAVRCPNGIGRKSFALYLYSKERPKAETGAMHSTIYYERPLPETIQPGKVLARADYDELMRLTVRRDEMLKFLYHREKQFNTAIGDLSHLLQRYEQENPGPKLAAPPLPASSGPVLVADAGGRYILKDGAGAIPGLAPYSTFVLNKERRPKVGDWVLAYPREQTALRLVCLMEEIGGLFLVSQPVKAASFLVSPGEIYGVVAKVHADNEQPVLLPAGLPAPLSTWLLAHAFVAVHRIKRRLFGRLRSRFLWRLSLWYREGLKKVGLRAPLLPPT